MYTGQVEGKKYVFSVALSMFSAAQILSFLEDVLFYFCLLAPGEIPFYPSQTLPFSNSSETTNFLFRLNGVFSTHLLSRRKERYSAAIVFPHTQASRVSEGNVFASSTRVEPCSGTSRHEEKEEEILANSTPETNRQNKTN